MSDKKKESGMVIVEATIVFPIMFLIIFIMIFTGNAYLQKCRVDSYVTQLAIAGASYCADPMLDDVEGGNIPSYDNVDIRPYRYFIDEMGDIQEEIDIAIEQKIKSMGSGLFQNMEPSNILINTKYNSNVIYSTFSVDVQYKIKIPIKMLFATDFFYMTISSHACVPVSDSTEFIRNVDMVEDYMQRTGVTDTIEKYINKAKEWFNKK